MNCCNILRICATDRKILFQGRQAGIPVLMSKPNNSVIDKAKSTVEKRFGVSHMHPCLVPDHLFESERFS